MREKLSACGNSSRTLALRSKVMSSVQCIIVSCGTRKGRKLSQSKYHSYHRPLADFTSVKKTKETDGCIIKIRGVWEAAGCSVVMEEKLAWPLEEGVLRRPSGSFPWNSLACSLHVVASQCCHLPLHRITKRILSRVNIYFMYKERQIWYFLSVSRS